MRRRYIQGFGSGLLLLCLLIAALTWAALFEIDQTVRAQGQLIPSGRTQVVQVADGGVLEQLDVAEGQQVKAGQRLAVLEKQRASAAVDEIQNKIAALSIASQRARAEAEGRVPDFSTYDKKFRSLVDVQRDLYDQNRLALSKDEQGTMAALSLAKEEFALIKKLYAQGDLSRVELMRTERQVIDLQQKLHAVQEKFRADARREVARLEEELAGQRSKLQERESVLGHTEIMSPVDGVVQSLKMNTLGGVLRAGDELLQISPTEDEILLEAKINPADIAQLSPGMKARVRLDAFDYSIYGSLSGELVYISADTITEGSPNGRQTVYYKARVRLDAQQANPRLTLSQLKTGMTTTLDIQIGRRTVLQFIAKPIYKTFSGSMTQR